MDIHTYEGHIGRYLLVDLTNNLCEIRLLGKDTLR